MTYDRAAIMRDAHKRFRDGKRLGLGWTFEQCLATARAAAARRAVMTMTHEGYLATLEVDDDAGVIHGRVINARAVLTFEGETLADLQQAFADTIVDYRDWCKERGVEPEKPYSGTLSLRIAPELHRRVAEQAAKAGESINQFIADRLEEVA